MLGLNLPVSNKEVTYSMCIRPGEKSAFPLRPYILEEFLQPSLLYTE